MKILIFKRRIYVCGYLGGAENGLYIQGRGDATLVTLMRTRHIKGVVKSF